jgi:hypothetical protein
MLLRDWHIVCSFIFVRRLTMRRSILGFVVVTVFLALSNTTSFITAAQQGGAPAEAAPAGAPRGGGARGPAAPATVPFENPNDAMRHQGFVDIAKKGNIDLLFVGDSITVSGGTAHAEVRRDPRLMQVWPYGTKHLES